MHYLDRLLVTTLIYNPVRFTQAEPRECVPTSPLGDRTVPLPCRHRTDFLRIVPFMPQALVRRNL